MAARNNNRHHIQSHFGRNADDPLQFLRVPRMQPGLPFLRGRLFQATDGNLYGTTTSTAYRWLSMGLAPFVSVAPASANVGGSVTVLGYGLTGATAVTFGGFLASFAVNSTGPAITATVRRGATSGTFRSRWRAWHYFVEQLPFQVRE